MHPVEDITSVECGVRGIEGVYEGEGEICVCRPASMVLHGHVLCMCVNVHLINAIFLCA